MTRIVKIAETYVEIDGNLFKVVFDDKYGYSLISRQTGTTYELLEGLSYFGEQKYTTRCTSDIVFIFETGETGYTRLVNYVFGATFEEDSLINCAKYINDYEHGKDMHVDHRIGF